MYHQINPTELFRERELALLQEAHNRRLGWRLGKAGGGAKARSARVVVAALGLLAALVVAVLLLVGL